MNDCCSLSTSPSCSFTCGVLSPFPAALLVAWCCCPPYTTGPVRWYCTTCTYCTTRMQVLIRSTIAHLCTVRCGSRIGHQRPPIDILPELDSIFKSTVYSMKKVILLYDQLLISEPCIINNFPPNRSKLGKRFSERTSVFFLCECSQEPGRRTAGSCGSPDTLTLQPG